MNDINVDSHNNFTDNSPATLTSKNGKEREGKSIPKNIFHDDSLSRIDDDDIELSRKLDWKHVSAESSHHDIKEIILQWWVGEVDKVHEDYFTAYLVDLDGKETGAEFDLDSVFEADRHLLRPKAQFAYYISRRDYPTGRQTISKLEFTKLPRYLPFESENELNQKVQELFGPELIFDE